MLKERTQFIRRILYIADLVMLSVCFFLTYYFLFYFSFFYTHDFLPDVQIVKKPHSMGLYLQAYWLALFLWAVILKLRGEYQLRVQTYTKLIGNHCVNGFLFLGAFTSLAFIFKMEFISRLFMIVYALSAVGLLITSRLVALSVAYTVRSRGYNYRNLLLVGTGRRAREFLKLVARHPEWGYRVIGILDQDSQMVGKEIEGCKVVGVLGELPGFLEKNVVDEVVFVIPRNWLKEIEKSILYCEAVGVPATLSTDFFDLEMASGIPREMDGLTFLTFETRHLRDPEILLKRTMDIAFSSVILAVTSPALVFVAAVIKLTSPGPVFFKQKRCGRNGREFMLYKFRSMVEGAEAKLEELKAHNEMSGPVFKMTNDPRLTKVGKFLRRTSLDEFPQFWNVLRGDMSIVGPRPPIPSEVEKYEPWQRRRLSMKPGITCIWQVSGRNNINFENWMKLDLQYIDRWSLWLDIKIIFMTLRAVLSGTGAK